MVALQNSYSAAARVISTTLSLYDANIITIDESSATLRQKIMTAIGTGQTQGLQESIAGAFDQFRAALNAGDCSGALLAGAQTDAMPFKPQTLADTVGDTPTATQMDALKTAMGQIDAALPGVRAINAENGRKQAETETLGTRADDRANLLSELISTNEDADYGQIASDLSQQQTVLRASYSVFTQLSSLSLTQYLK
ncbi:hypothetical protein ASG67_01315 [Sphingomonas sp. Leaf339]|nr:hypothetical protein ASG67_01315 [Sphingomonas sp. Leaf339]